MEKHLSEMTERFYAQIPHHPKRVSRLHNYLEKPVYDSDLPVDKVGKLPDSE